MRAAELETGRAVGVQSRLVSRVHEQEQVVGAFFSRVVLGPLQQAAPDAPRPRILWARRSLSRHRWSGVGRPEWSGGTRSRLA